MYVCMLRWGFIDKNPAEWECKFNIEDATKGIDRYLKENQFLMQILCYNFF